MPPDSDTIDVQVRGQEAARLESQIQNEIEMEASYLATPTQTASVVEIPILPPKKRQADFSPEATQPSTRTRCNFSPFKGATLRNPFNRTPKATSVQEALEMARNLVIQAANLAENNPTEQTSLLDLVEVFRDYTETGRVNKKNSAILGDQISSLSNASKELRDKIRRLEKPIQASQQQQQHEKQQPTTQPISYAAAAAAAAVASKEQQWTTIQKKIQKAKPSLRERQLVLVSQGAPAAFDALRLRNAFNEAFTAKGGVQSPVVASVTISSKGNKVLTTTPAFTAKYLLENQNIWQDITTFKTAQPIVPWFKVVIHELPTNHGLEVIKEEIETFNKGLKVVGTPFWLTPESKRGQQSYGSACVAFATEEEALKAIRGKLYILGESLRAEKLRIVRDVQQCDRCQGFGHEKARCLKLACQLCAEPHSTSQHKCKTCSTKGKACVHTIYKCANCGEPHAANSLSCEILTARARR